MVKVSYVNSAHCKITTYILKRMKYLLVFSKEINYLLDI